MKEQEKNEILKLLESIPDEFRVFEKGVNEKAFDEYYRQLDIIEDKDINLSELEESWKKTDSIELLKTILVILSEKGDVLSYRKIENLIKTLNSDTLEFGLVTLHFARLNLENQLLDEPVGMISTGLGGKGNKIRYYFVLIGNTTITEELEEEIKRVSDLVSETKDSELEDVENFGEYIILKILISMDIAVADWVDSLMIQCPFVKKEYLCTNVEKPESGFISRWINDDLRFEGKDASWRSGE